VRTTAPTEGYINVFVRHHSITENKKIGRLQVESRRPEREETYAVVLVKTDDETNYPSFDKEYLKTFLNTNSFNQIFIEWTPSNQEKDKISICSSLAKSSSGELLDEIRNAYRAQGGIFNSNYSYIFITSDSVSKNIATANGVARGQFCAIFNRSVITTVHELGHLLGLSHIFEDGQQSTRIDFRCKRTVNKFRTTNFMDYPTGENDRRNWFSRCQCRSIHTE